MKLQLRVYCETARYLESGERRGNVFALHHRVHRLLSCP